MDDSEIHQLLHNLIQQIEDEISIDIHHTLESILDIIELQHQAFESTRPTHAQASASGYRQQNKEQEHESNKEEDRKQSKNIKSKKKSPTKKGGKGKKPSPGESTSDKANEQLEQENKHLKTKSKGQATKKKKTINNSKKQEQPKELPKKTVAAKASTQEKKAEDLNKQRKGSISPTKTPKRKQTKKAEKATESNVVEEILGKDSTDEEKNYPAIENAKEEEEPQKVSTPRETLESVLLLAPESEKEKELQDLIRLYHSSRQENQRLALLDQLNKYLNSVKNFNSIREIFYTILIPLIRESTTEFTQEQQVPEENLIIQTISNLCVEQVVESAILEQNEQEKGSKAIHFLLPNVAEHEAEKRYDTDGNPISLRRNILGEPYAPLWACRSYIGRDRHYIYKVVKQRIRDQVEIREKERLMRLNAKKKKSEKFDELKYLRQRKPLSLRDKRKTLETKAPALSLVEDESEDSDFDESEEDD